MATEIIAADKTIPGIVPRAALTPTPNLDVRRMAAHAPLRSSLMGLWQPRRRRFVPVFFPCCPHHLGILLTRLNPLSQLSLHKAKPPRKRRRRPSDSEDSKL
jgi:hypothetical protein